MLNFRWVGLGQGTRSVERIRKLLPIEVDRELGKLSEEMARDVNRAIPYSGKRPYRDSMKGGINVWAAPRVRPGHGLFVVGPDPHHKQIWHLARIHEEGLTVRRPRPGRSSRYRPHTATYRKTNWVVGAFRRLQSKAVHRIGRTISAVIR